MADASAVPPEVEPGEAGFDAFFRSRYPRLCQAVMLLTGGSVDAEELAQEAFVRILERWDRVAVMESPDGYLYRTALNLVRKRARGLAVRRRRGVHAQAPSDPVAAAEDRVAILEMLESLPPAQREAVVLVDWLGVNAEEAGALLGIEPVSVRTRLHRARAALRDRFGGDDA